MNNRKWNSKNPCQGNYLKALCVCSAGLLRSPTTANVLANYPFYFNTRAVGLEESFALIPIDEVLLHWADIVICMDYTQCQRIRDMDFEGEIYNFQLPDCYNFMEADLIKVIENRANNLQEWLWEG